MKYAKGLGGFQLCSEMAFFKHHTSAYDDQFQYGFADSSS